MITLIYSNPDTESFDHTILQAVTDMFNDLGREYQVIDLYADGFDPVMTSAGKKLSIEGRYDDPLVKRYGDMLAASQQVIFIFPVWWGMMPAMLKGFFDKVFLQGIAYDFSAQGAMMPLFRISRTSVITTSESPSSMFGQFMQGYLAPMVLNTVGMTGEEWYNCDSTSTKTNDQRQEFIQSTLKQLI